MDVKKEVEKKTESIIRMSKISLALDRYSDIFSDFDPRDYSKRILSQDFLEEAERASREKGGKLELRLFIPASERKKDQEPVIKKRLRENFKNSYKRLGREVRGIIRKGISFVIIGIVLMFIATYIFFKYPEASLLTSFLVVFLEPAGWFFFWEGLGQLIFEPKKVKPKLEFYKKMSRCEISFFSEWTSKAL